MTDLSVPNAAPGRCAKCHGAGVYRWGPALARSGDCHACKGTGRQSRADIARNRAFNRYQIARICSL